MKRNYFELLYRVALFFISQLLFASLSCNDNPTTHDDIKPGRRDYTWTVDTLFSEDWFGVSDIWGINPNSIWLAATAVSPKDFLWYYDGFNWNRSGQLLNQSLNTIFGISQYEVWAGDSFGTILKNSGNGWQKFQSIKITGFSRVAISTIIGSSEKNLIAVGFADSIDGANYIGVILKYDGVTWKLADIPPMKVGFIYAEVASGKEYIISADVGSGSVFKLFLYDGEQTLHELYSGYNWPSLFSLSNNIYVVISKKIYKYSNGELKLWKEFPGTTFRNTLLGRSEKDFFSSGEDGILHYNGTDFALLYPTANLGLVGALIFEKEVIFNAYDSERQLNIIIKGKLIN